MYFQMYSPLMTRIPPEGLLKPRVKFVAKARTERRGQARITLDCRLKVVNHGIVASPARQHQVLVEWRLQRAGIRNLQHCAGRLDVIRDSRTRLYLVSSW